MTAVDPTAGNSASPAPPESDVSQAERGSIPDGTPNSRFSPLTTSAIRSQRNPAAPAPARRQGVGASAATAT